jgi:hypothetical protein
MTPVGLPDGRGTFSELLQGLVEGTVMRLETPERDGPFGPLAALCKIIPFEADATSDRLGWVGLEAVRYRAAPAFELNPPAGGAGRAV